MALNRSKGRGKGQRSRGKLSGPAERIVKGSLPEEEVDKQLDTEDDAGFAPELPPLPPQQDAEEQLYAGAEPAKPVPPPAIKIPFVSAHIKKGALTAFAFYAAPGGLLPISCTIPLMGGNSASKKVTPVNLGAEYANPSINEGIAKCKEALMVKGRITSLATAAKDLVIRARAGDQNAMAIIAMVKVNKDKGKAIACISFKLIEDYIARNPVDGVRSAPSPNMGNEENLKCRRMATMLANGPPISNPKIGDFASKFGEEGSGVIYGKVNCFNPGLDTVIERLDSAKANALQIGRVLGMAQALQEVRLPRSIISRYCPIAGWELGERMAA